MVFLGNQKVLRLLISSGSDAFESHFGTFGELFLDWARWCVVGNQDLGNLWPWPSAAGLECES